MTVYPEEHLRIIAGISQHIWDFDDKITAEFPKIYFVTQLNFCNFQLCIIFKDRF